MAKIEESVVIRQPVEEVFRYVTKYERHPEWRSETLEARGTSDGPTEVGSTGWEVSQFLGRRIEATSVITQFEPNNKLMCETTSEPFTIKGGHTVEPVDGETRYTFVAEGEPGGFFKLAEPILTRIGTRHVSTNLRNLKDLLEAGADAENKA